MQNNSSMRLITSKITYSETAPTTALLKTSQYLINNIHKTGSWLTFRRPPPGVNRIINHKILLYQFCRTKTACDKLFIDSPQWSVPVVDGVKGGHGDNGISKSLSQREIEL